MRVVNAIILNKEKFLVIKRKEGLHSGLWAFPGGIAEKGETDEQALSREIKEETGLQIKKIIRKIADYNYSGEDNTETKGSSYLVLVDNFDVQINNEVSEFKWVSLEELEQLNHVPYIEEEAMKALYN